MWANTEPLISLIIACGGENKKNRQSQNVQWAACVYTVLLSSELWKVVWCRSMTTHLNNSWRSLANAQNVFSQNIFSMMHVEQNADVEIENVFVP